MLGSLSATRHHPRRRTIAVVAAVLVAGVATVVVAASVLDRSSPAAAEVVLTTDDFTYSPQHIEVSAVAVELTMANVDAVTHTFTIPALGVDLVVGGGEARSLTFDVREGTYEFICTVPGHDTPGMRGELVVR